MGPSNEDQATAFQQLSGALEAASIMTGAVIRIEKDFVNGGHCEILESLNPKLFDAVGMSNPRVVSGCSILLYFTYKVLYIMLAKMCTTLCMIVHSLKLTWLHWLEVSSDQSTPNGYKIFIQQVD